MTERSVDLLPEGVISVVCSFLSGIDAFHLSHSSHWWLNCLSTAFPWRQRLNGNESTTSKIDGITWKQKYIQRRSLQFQSCPLRPQWQGDQVADRSFSWLLRTPSPTVWKYYEFDLCSWKSESFSFDSWFFLLPDSEEVVSGGILFGGQSDKVVSGSSPLYFQPFAMVSTSALKCSVLDDLEVVKRDLETMCWYHLVLTYDWDRKEQKVYLDGVNVSARLGAVHRHWRRLSYQQIGCGYIRSHDDAPRRDPFGWYTFHGVVDVFRVWKGALSSESVERLTRHECPSDNICKVQATCDRAADGKAPWSNANLIRCSRPTESKFVQKDDPFHC